jgi:hypothetical protein
MRMARVNVYLSDDLAAQAKQARLNVSAITQDAIRTNLAASATDIWLAGLTALDRTGIDTRVAPPIRHSPERHPTEPASSPTPKPLKRSPPTDRHRRRATLRSRLAEPRRGAIVNNDAHSQNDCEIRPVPAASGGIYCSHLRP